MTTPDLTSRLIRKSIEDQLGVSLERAIELGHITERAVDEEIATRRAEMAADAEEDRPPRISRRPVRHKANGARRHRKTTPRAMTRPQQVHKILMESGSPMTRTEIFDEMVRRGWMEDQAEDKSYAVSNFVTRLKRKGVVRELDGPKPRRLEPITGGSNEGGDAGASP